MKKTESTSNRLLLVLKLYHGKLKALDGVTASEKPGKNKWSKKEVLGHLIDSAANNHRRFVLMRMKEDMVLDGYNQNKWVADQDYQNRNWMELIAFWRSYNVHLAHIIRHYDERIFTLPFETHNLDKIAFNTLLKEDPATIHYMAEDYIDHMEYHLRRMV